MSSVNRLKAVVDLATPVVPTARTLQLAGLFDLPPTERLGHRLEVDLELPAKWNVGLIVGPSGCGKSTLARALWPERIASRWDWPLGQSVLDGFPRGMPIKDITGLLCAVGFSSPPSWLKPFAALSTGEQFRVHVARTLAEEPDLAVIDEFTSVVDRDVAKIASAAVQKAVRQRRQKLVAVTCHPDVAEWLEPDWIYSPLAGEFVAGRSLRRPPVEIEIARVRKDAWPLFRPHHYLSSALNPASVCFVAFVWGRPAAFAAALGFPHPYRPGWREHRLVVLPDFQGVGIGTVLSSFVASLFRALGKRYFSTTSHPAFIRHRLRSPFWKCTRLPSLNPRAGSYGDLGATTATGRLTAGFEYVGPARPNEAALLGIG